MKVIVTIKIIILVILYYSIIIPMFYRAALDNINTLYIFLSVNKEHEFEYEKKKNYLSTEHGALSGYKIRSLSLVKKENYLGMK